MAQSNRKFYRDNGAAAYDVYAWNDQAARQYEDGRAYERSRQYELPEEQVREQPYRRVKAKTAIAPFTRSITASGSLPIRSRRRDLSIVRICSSRITLSRVRPQLAPASSMCVGRRALPVCEVMAAAITVGLWRLPVSFCTISTGRTPPCSLPTTGLRSA